MKTCICLIFVNNQLDEQLFFLYLFTPILYMFRTTKCSSSGESTVSIRSLAYVVCHCIQVTVWYAGMYTTRSPIQSDIPHGCLKRVTYIIKYHKIHKANSPIRPIINWQNAPAYRLTKLLSKLLQLHIPLPKCSLSGIQYN